MTRPGAAVLASQLCLLLAAALPAQGRPSPVQHRSEQLPAQASPRGWATPCLPFAGPADSMFSTLASLRGEMGNPTAATQSGRGDGFPGNFTDRAAHEWMSWVEWTTPSYLSRGAPIALHSGEVLLQEIDLQVPSRGFPFLWMRSYGSRASFSGELGHNWDHPYNRRVTVLAGGDVSICDGFGGEDVYRRAGSRQFRSPAGVFRSLQRNRNGTYTEIDWTGMRFDYGQPTRRKSLLLRITDRAGNTSTIKRRANGRIRWITDTQGRQYRFSYDGSGRIVALRDFGGRQIRYTYDEWGDLGRKRSPVVVGTPTGNDFPNGKTTLYTYTSGSADPRLNHNLVSVVAPAHNVNDDPTLSKPWLTVTYDAATNPESIGFDRAASAWWGHCNGWGGQAVGGTVTLAYETNLANDPEAPPGARLRTTETDPNGNVTVHFFYEDNVELRTIERSNRGVRPAEGDYVTDYTYTTEGLLASCTKPRGNAVTFLYDNENPLRRSAGNLLEVRQRATGGGGATDLVTRFTYEPVFNSLRTMTDPRGFPAGTVPLTAAGQLDLAHPTVARYTATRYFDYQEGSGFQASHHVPLPARIPENLGDLNGAPDFDKGHVVKYAHPTIQTPGPNLGDVVEELYRYNDRGQLLTHIDPEGHWTASEFIPQGGYLKSVTRNAAPSGLLRPRYEYEYDIYGNLRATRDAKGQQTDFVVNALNQVVRRTSRVVSGTTRYVTDWIYDGNDNVVQLDRANLDENGVPYPHAMVSNLYQYDILDRLRVLEEDKSLNSDTGMSRMRTDYGYDANMNRVAVTLPAPTLGTQPSATIITRVYDERDLLFRVVRGDDDTDPTNPWPATAVVVTHNYDPNRSLLETIDSILQVQTAHAARAPISSFPGSAAGDVTAYTYDDFDRLVGVADGEGNVRAYGYDLASNRTSETLTGWVDHTPGAAFRLLAGRTTVHDELNRVVKTDALHRNAAGQAVGDGLSTTTYEYDLDSKIEAVTDDNGVVTRTEWDNADRKHKEINNLGDEIEYVYDDNSNVTDVIRRDISTELGSPPEVFTTTYIYDGLDRITAAYDPGHTTDIEYLYDSRGNVVETRDRETGGGQQGNRVLFEHDALNRRVQTERILTDNGRGNGTEIGRITTSQSWDQWLLCSRTDGESNTTSYAYDEVGRLVTITFADGSSCSRTHNTDDQCSSWTDQNGTVCVMSHDALDRLLSCAVTRAPGVEGATFEAYGYDGAGRITLADTDDIFGQRLTNLREWDSLSNRTLDKQGAHRVDSAFDGVGNRQQLGYPGRVSGLGRRLITADYDGLNRLHSLSEGPAGAPTRIGTWHLKGGGACRVERRTYGDSQNPIAQLDCSYDDRPRLIDMVHFTRAFSVAHFQYGLDEMDNRLFEKRVHDSGQGSVWQYDSVYRLFGDKDADLTAVSAGQRIQPETFLSQNHDSYTYDDAGNRAVETNTVGGVPITTIYTPGVLNQYLHTQTGPTITSYTYDNNGNMTGDGTRTFAYDFRNRLVRVTDRAGNVGVAPDVFGRTVRRVIESLGTKHTFIYDGRHCIEERDDTGAVTRQHIWINQGEIPVLLQQKTPTTTLWMHEDGRGNIVAVTDGTGAVVESATYSAFGEAVLQGTPTGNEFLFKSGRQDPATGLVDFGARVYDPRLGRFLQRCYASGPMYPAGWERVVLAGPSGDDLGHGNRRARVRRKNAYALARAVGRERIEVNSEAADAQLCGAGQGAQQQARHASRRFPRLTGWAMRDVIPRVLIGDYRGRNPDTEEGGMNKPTRARFLSPIARSHSGDGDWVGLMAGLVTTLPPSDCHGPGPRPELGVAGDYPSGYGSASAGALTSGGYVGSHVWNVPIYARSLLDDGTPCRAICNVMTNCSPNSWSGTLTVNRGAFR